MTAVKLVNAKGKSGALALAEDTIARQGIEDALRAAAFAYDQRLTALRHDAAMRECALQEEYLAEVAQIIGGE